MFWVSHIFRDVALQNVPTLGVLAKGMTHASVSRQQNEMIFCPIKALTHGN